MIAERINVARVPDRAVIRTALPFAFGNKRIMNPVNKGRKIFIVNIYLYKYYNGELNSATGSDL